jgi:hypothetical protein
MKKTFLQWSRRYAETFRQTRLLTQLFSFCVALILLMSFVQSVMINYSFKGEVSARVWQNIINELTLQMCVALLFASRFALLFFKEKIYFWLSQIVWLITYLLIFSQLHSTEFGGCTKNMLPMLGENFSYVFVAYLIFSPLRQLVTLFTSFSGTFIK